MIDEEKKLTQIAIKFLNFRPRLAIEVSKRLQKVSQNNSLINQIISKLEKSGFLNDTQFITDYINYHAKTKLQGPHLIRAKLMGLGAKPGDIETITKSVLDQETQISLIRQLINKKSKEIPLDYSAKSKLIRFLCGRGFPLNIIMRVID
jgi:SOS response regulatory protein OraA/RecX